MTQKKRFGLQKIMYNIVSYMIKKNMSNNVGKFRHGDLVKFNWKAKYHLPLAIRSEFSIARINELEKIAPHKEQCTFDYTIQPEANEGCDVFWLRKLHWWEHKTI